LDQSIQQILCGALREQGIHVLDAGDVTQGMLADAVASMKLQGGIGIRTQQRDLTLYFLDEHGFAADSSFSRKFEDAMDRMAEEVCTLAVGTCLQIHGIRSRYLKKCGRWLAFPESYCIGLETQEPIPDDELLGGLGLRLGSQDEKKVLTLVVDADGFCVRDEQEKEYSREMTRCLLLQAYAESGSMKGYWPIPADCWDEEMKKACLKRGIEIERSSIRQDLWIRALIRQGHSAQVCDAAVFFDPWLAAALLVSVLRKAGKTLSQWSRIPDNSVWIREYPEELAPELTRRLAELRAEAAEMLDSAMILEDQGEVYLEWGGEDSRIRLYAGPGQQEKLELMSRGLLE